MNPHNRRVDQSRLCDRLLEDCAIMRQRGVQALSVLDLDQPAATTAGELVGNMAQ